MSALQLFDGDGFTISLPSPESPDRQRSALHAILGHKFDETVPGDVLKTANNLGFASPRGTPRGFLTILPRGTALQAKVEAFNKPHLEALNAVRIDVPSVFELAGSSALSHLTESYEAQGRVFRLQTPSTDWRLAYAADPGLLSYLQDRVLRPALLPYAIISPMEVFRLLPSGETGGLYKNRQYHLPDLHILCGDDARDTFCVNLRLATEGARFWDPEGLTFFIDVAEDFIQEWPSLGSDLARIVGAPTVLRTVPRRPRYYAFRAGLMISTGSGAVMLYNFQWDDTNARLFNIRRTDGGHVTIIHGTIAAGWPKLLSWVLGRSLSGLAPKIIPPELDSPELTIIPVRSEFRCHADMLANSILRDRDVHVNDDSDSLGKRVLQLRRRWSAYYVVIGDREASGLSAPMVESIAPQHVPCTLQTFLDIMAPRLNRCHARVRSTPLPFVNG